MEQTYPNVSPSNCQPNRPNSGILHDKVDFRAGCFRFKGNNRSVIYIIGCCLAGYAAYRWAKDFFDKREYKISPSRSANLTNSSEMPSTTTETSESTSGDTEMLMWHKYWQINFPILPVNLPPIFCAYLENCPDGCQEAVIATLTTALGAVFSNVQATYLDGKKHRPNLITVVEGPWGSGKGKCKEVYDSLLARRIQRDREKFACPDNKIIQALSVNTSSSRLIDIMANNKGVHGIIFEPEIRTMIEAMKKPNGLTYDVIRKAFDNDAIERINKSKNAPQGFFTVALNMVLTGTPGDTNKFIERQLEGGTASRIWWVILPEVENPSAPPFLMPDDEEVEHFRDKIDDWADQYSYHTDEQGNDIPAESFTIDLDYVNDELRRWLEYQTDLSEEQDNPARRDVCRRIAAMAFQQAIVYHMLYVNPSPKQRKERQEVLALTIYMANYCMERFLHKFGKLQNEQHRQFTAEELVSVPHRNGAAEASTGSSPLTVPEGVDKGKVWAELYDELKEQGASDGYGTIGNMYGCTKDTVYSAIRRYRAKQNGSKGTN